MGNEMFAMPKPMKMGGVKYMRADGSAWGGFAACREGDVGAFPVVALDDLRAAVLEALEKAAKLEHEAGIYSKFDMADAIRQLAEQVKALEFRRSGG